MLTWSVDDVQTRALHAVREGLAVKEADVVEGGGFDDEAFLAVPNDVLPVWRQNLVEVLWGEAGRGITSRDI